LGKIVPAGKALGPTTVAGAGWFSEPFRAGRAAIA